LAGTLSNLGSVQLDSDALETAQAAFEGALGICCEMAAVEPELYRPALAARLNNVEALQRRLHAGPGAARASFQEGLRICAELARVRLEVCQPEMLGEALFALLPRPDSAGPARTWKSAGAAWHSSNGRRPTNEGHAS
jgi:hypothetical protein